MHTETQTQRIQKLPDTLINQIAAGEVIERPASCLKELIENSLDAGATEISVHLKKGGMEEIQVIDNGIGLSPLDLPLCAERHTTSKIKKFEDLMAIETFGFRGEALSSLASVSDLKIRSHQKGATGYEIHYHYGKTDGQIYPVSCPPGTQIIAKDIFKELPARQKFLKSAGTEFSHCARMVREMAMGQHDVRFSLTHNERLIQSWKKETQIERIENTMSFDWKGWVLDEETDNGLKLWAYFSPTHQLSDQSEIYLYVNHRLVKNRALIQAVRQAFKDTLGPHHEPTAFVFLDVRQDWVDVNVHPQKLEVKVFQQESIYPWILNSVRKAIAKQNTVREIRIETTQETPATEEIHISIPHVEPAKIAYQEAFEVVPKVAPPLTHPIQTHLEQNSLHYFGQARASFLICQDEKGLVIIDQHALHEKLRFEELKVLYQNKELKSQKLLLPTMIKMDPAQIELLKENFTTFNELGFELEDYGKGDFAVHAIPEILPETEIKEVIQKILSDLENRPTTSASDQLFEFLRPWFATLACHSVVKAYDKLDPSQAKNLLKDFSKIQEGWTCPHGRPILFRLPWQKIEKEFQRI